VTIRELPPAFDLLAACTGPAPFLFERDGRGVAAPSAPGAERGASDETGIRALGERALRRLRTLEGPHAAVGGFAFAADVDGWLDVPEWLVRRTEPGPTILVGSGPSQEPRFAPLRLSGPTAPIGGARIRERPSADAYGEAVVAATERIRDRELTKVVLARLVEADADRDLDPRRLAHRLRAVDPHAFTFARATGTGTDPSMLVGASPELLVARNGRTVRSTPLAGSAPRAGDVGQDRARAEALRSSAKDREEHAVVVEAIAATLGPVCERLDWDPEPVLLETANLWHLATRFEGILREPAPSAVDLVAALHPTPAVCGTPRDTARAIIAALEPFDRGGYAGPVGWMDAAGDGEWAIALRCAELEGAHARLYAGAGIVGASEPALEVEETERKFRAFLDALRWG